MDDLAVFRERLSGLLFERKISVVKFSQMIDVSFPTVYSWIRGKIKISLNSLLKIADSLNCSIDFLLGRTDEVLDFIPKPCPPFYERLRLVMEEKKITRYRIVKESEIGDDYFTVWKKGSDPHVYSLIKLADYIGCTVDYLVGREN